MYVFIVAACFGYVYINNTCMMNSFLHITLLAHFKEQYLHVLFCTILFSEITLESMFISRKMDIYGDSTQAHAFLLLLCLLFCSFVYLGLYLVCNWFVKYILKMNLQVDLLSPYFEFVLLRT